jgi:hypothetical protein
MVTSDSPVPRPGASPHGSCGALRRQRIRRKAGTGRYGGCDPCDRCLEPQGSEVKSASPDAAGGHKPSRKPSAERPGSFGSAPTRALGALFDHPGGRPSILPHNSSPQFFPTILPHNSSPQFFPTIVIHGSPSQPSPHSSRRETLRAARGSSAPEPDLSWAPGAESPLTSATPRTPQPAARSQIAARPFPGRSASIPPGVLRARRTRNAVRTNAASSPGAGCAGRWQHTQYDTELLRAHPQEATPAGVLRIERPA